MATTTAAEDREASVHSSTEDVTMREDMRRMLTNPGSLIRSELFWRHLQPWLEERGYELRPRYRKGWVPSWSGSGKDFFMFEDGQISPSRIRMDATRLSDNALVFFKRNTPDSSPHELPILRHLSSDTMTGDQRNHTIPLFEVLDIPENAGELMVMPFFRAWHDPPLETVGEAISFFSQIFEGLQFMHEHRIAHRDCTYNNIVYDPRSLYSDGFHPVDQDKKRNWKGRAKHSTRTRCPVRYYYIDFGHARRYDPDDGPPLELPLRGGDKSAPEHRPELLNTPCDPFPTDIYYLGNLIKEEFILKLENFAFMEPLIADMTKEDPAQRPKIDEVVTRFQEMVKSLSRWKLRQRIVQKKDWMITRAAKAVPYFYRSVGYVLTGKPAIPEPQVPK